MILSRDTSMPADADAILALEGLQHTGQGYFEEFQKKVLELEKEYVARCQPLHARRATIVTGVSSPTPAEIELGKKRTDAKSRPKTIPNGSIKASPIRHFWLEALKYHRIIAKTITERDEDALKSLKDIRLSFDVPGASCGSFLLEFEFGENEYFENRVLTKTYLFEDTMSPIGHYKYLHAEGTTIKWKENKDLRKECVTKKQANRKTQRTRTITTQMTTPSFFDFFSPPATLDQILAIERFPHPDEIMEATKVDEDREIGEELKDKIIPRAVDYYTGQAKEWDIYGTYDSEEEDIDDLNGVDEDVAVEDSDDASEEWNSPYPGPKVGRNRPEGCIHPPLDPGCQQQ